MASLHCVVCHGLGFESAGGAVPDLRIRQPTVEFMNAIVRGGALEFRGMPQFEWMSAEDLEAIHAYLVNRAWDDYEAQSRETATGVGVE